MKILAAEGHILCCGLVRTLQLLREDVCVTGADSIDEMLTLIPGLPDLGLVLLDTSMPGMENFAGLRRLVEKLPNVPVVVTSPSESSTHIVAAICSGARGYFSPSTKACVLQHALPLILMGMGEIYIPACALRLDHGNGMLRPEGLATRMGNAGGKLTSRQQEAPVCLISMATSSADLTTIIFLLSFSLAACAALLAIMGPPPAKTSGFHRSVGTRGRSETRYQNINGCPEVLSYQQKPQIAGCIFVL
jgi:DNA-binding NarL/FixJ family response regulator